MPQIWVTYSELADHLGLDEHEARGRAIDLGLPRRKCSDDLTRVKLTEALGVAFMTRMPAVRAAVLAEAPIMPLRDIDEAALVAAVEAGGVDYIAGEFSDLLVSRLKTVQAISGGKLAAAS